MSGESKGSRVERILESALGAVSDWLELVLDHENERRARQAAGARARSEQRTRVVMAVLGAATVGVLFWLSHR